MMGTHIAAMTKNLRIGTAVSLASFYHPLRLAEEVAVCGMPEKVIDDIEEMRETLPLDYLMIAPLSHSSFVMFTEKVLPHFQ